MENLVAWLISCCITFAEKVDEVAYQIDKYVMKEFNLLIFSMGLGRKKNRFKSNKELGICIPQARLRALFCKKIRLELALRDATFEVASEKDKQKLLQLEKEVEEEFKEYAQSRSKDPSAAEEAPEFKKAQELYDLRDAIIDCIEDPEKREEIFALRASAWGEARAHAETWKKFLDSDIPMVYHFEKDGAVMREILRALTPMWVVSAIKRMFKCEMYSASIDEEETMQEKRDRWLAECYNKKENEESPKSINAVMRFLLERFFSLYKANELIIDTFEETLNGISNFDYFVANNEYIRVNCVTKYGKQFTSRTFLRRIADHKDFLPLNLMMELCGYDNEDDLEKDLEYLEEEAKYLNVIAFTRNVKELRFRYYPLSDSCPREVTTELGTFKMPLAAILAQYMVANGYQPDDIDIETLKEVEDSRMYEYVRSDVANYLMGRAQVGKFDEFRSQMAHKLVKEDESFAYLLFNCEGELNTRDSIWDDALNEERNKELERIKKLTEEMNEEIISGRASLEELEKKYDVSEIEKRKLEEELAQKVFKAAIEEARELAKLQEEAFKEQ